VPRVSPPPKVIEPKPLPLPIQMPPVPPALPPVLPGLTALEFVCPGQPGVLLALDADGRANALIIDAGPQTSDQRVQACVYKLVCVGAWLRANAALLGAITRGRMNEELTPRLHLITDRPSSVRGLIDSDLRLHACGQASAAVDGLVLMPVN